MSINHGGTAFPAQLRNEGSETIIGFHGESIASGYLSNYGGMTLRDYFAAKAMQSFASTEYARRLDCEHWAEHAYMLADAMLAERAK